MNKELKKAGYAFVGVYEFAYDKARGLFDNVRKVNADDVMSVYEDLSKRGQKFVKSVSRSKPVKRATTQSKNAARQLKGATTSLRKAAGTQEVKAS